MFGKEAKYSMYLEDINVNMNRFRNNLRRGNLEIFEFLKDKLFLVEGIKV